MWWTRPLGLAVARSLQLGDMVDERLTFQRATDMLGISKGAVSTMVQRGTLDRHPDGGVRLGSVLERLLRRAEI